jgi:hypothetical protein
LDRLGNSSSRSTFNWLPRLDLLPLLLQKLHLLLAFGDASAFDSLDCLGDDVVGWREFEKLGIGKFWLVLGRNAEGLRISITELFRSFFGLVVGAGGVSG